VKSANAMLNIFIDQYVTSKIIKRLTFDVG
jgi:hypothetical protein